MKKNQCTQYLPELNQINFLFVAEPLIFTETHEAADINIPASGDDNAEHRRAQPFALGGATAEKWAPYHTTSPPPR